MTNLWEETIKTLSENGKTFDDVLFIQGDDFGITKENFEEVAKKSDYYAGYGSAKVAGDLVLVGEGWWLERFEYDGAEGWSFKETPIRINETKEVKRLAGGMWNTLGELNDPDLEDFIL